MSFCVITEIPDANNGDSGNLAAALDLYRVEGFGMEETVKRIDPLLSLSLRVPVFSLGEIIPVDSTGREYGGYQRKPSKWFVGCEYFDTIEEAIARSKEAMEGFPSLNDDYVEAERMRPAESPTGPEEIICHGPSGRSETHNLPVCFHNLAEHDDYGCMYYTCNCKEPGERK